MTMFEDDDLKGEVEDDVENDDVEEEDDDDWGLRRRREKEEEEDRSQDPRVCTHCVGNSRCSRDC